MKCKKILFISAFPPNERTAGQNYSQLLINDFIDSGYDIDLVYFKYPGHEVEVNEKVKILKSVTVKTINCIKLPFIYPLFSKRFDKGLLNYLNDRASRYDILYFDFSQVHVYARYISHPKKILMCHDVIYQKTKRQHPILSIWVRVVEKIMLKSANLVLTFSDKDSQLIKQVYDLDSMPVNFYLKNRLPTKTSVVQENIFCFYGAWNRKENSEVLEWFLKKVYPYVSKNYSYKIIGGGMSLKIQTKIKKYKEFEYIGFVDDPVSEVSKYQALLAPLLHGAGVKVKVIDALTSGTKVIGSSIAFEGISDNSMYPLFYECNTAREFANVLNNWICDDGVHKLMAAKEFFERYDVNHLPELLEKSKNEQDNKS